jgi:HAE1 family hydrophobic/amphiphilic exporter-1
VYRFAQLSLKNRAVVALVTIAIVVAGVFSMGSLKRELIPSLQIPMAGIIAVDYGVAPQVIYDQLTDPIETAARGVAGVTSITSNASTSMSLTMVEFDYGTNMDTANQKLTTAITQIQNTLPDGVTPTVITGSMDDLPILQVAVAGKDGAQVDPATIAGVVDTVLTPKLTELADVRSADVSGYSSNQVTITLNTAAMAGAGISATQVSTVLQNNGLVMPAGTITQNDQTISVEVGSSLASVDDISAIPLVPAGAAPGTAPVSLGQIASVIEAPGAATSYSRLNGSDAVSISITKTPAGNTVDVSHAVKDVVTDANEVLATYDLEATIAFDQAPFIEQSITALAEEGLIGLVFACIIIFVFLMSIRSTLVSAVSIPLSLLATFIAMRLTGETLNILTLGALTISIGRVVDDSIVVIENIKRHLSYGEMKRVAIVGAVKEVGGAIAASTICTVAVFAPIGFTTGMVGELFRPFALTVTIAMLSSLIVALTIVPVLAYWFVKRPVVIDAADAEAQRLEAENKERNGWLQRAYLGPLKASLKHPVIVLIIAVLLLAGTVFCIRFMETNFLGSEDQDTLTVTETFPANTSLAVQNTDAEKVERALMDLDVVESVQTTVGSSGLGALSGATSASFSLTVDADRAGEAPGIIRDAMADVRDLVGTVTVPEGSSMMGTTTVDLVVRSDDPDSLEGAAQQVQTMAEGLEDAQEVTNNLSSSQTIVQIKVDRARAAQLGMTETQVSAVVAGLATPSQIGQISDGLTETPVYLSMGQAPASIDQLSSLPLGASEAGVVTLGQVASIEEVASPATITTDGGQRSATISIAPKGEDLGSLTSEVEDALADLELPAGVTVEVSGLAAMQNEAFGDLGLALLLAIAIVYIVMVATFGSLLQPFILLISIPFAATGALLALLITGTPLGVPSLIGLLMLIGIVVSNAIVLIDLINQYRFTGHAAGEGPADGEDHAMSIDDAIIEGARHRLRPIVMTALATILALTPMAIGLTGHSSFIGQPLAIVVIGGLLSSTALTLIVVPVLYRLEARNHDRRMARREERIAHARAVRAAAQAGPSHALLSTSATTPISAASALSAASAASAVSATSPVSKEEEDDWDDTATSRVVAASTTGAGAALAAALAPSVAGSPTESTQAANPAEPAAGETGCSRISSPFATTPTTPDAARVSPRVSAIEASLDAPVTARQPITDLRFGANAPAAESPFLDLSSPSPAPSQPAEEETRVPADPAGGDPTPPTEVAAPNEPFATDARQKGETVDAFATEAGNTEVIAAKPEAPRATSPVVYPASLPGEAPWGAPSAQSIADAAEPNDEPTAVTAPDANSSSLTPSNPATVAYPSSPTTPASPSSPSQPRGVIEVTATPERTGAAVTEAITETPANGATPTAAAYETTGAPVFDIPPVEIINTDTREMPHLTEQIDDILRHEHEVSLPSTPPSERIGIQALIYPAPGPASEPKPEGPSLPRE